MGKDNTGCKHQEAGILGAILEAGYLNDPVFKSSEYLKSKNILNSVYIEKSNKKITWDIKL